MDKLVSSLPKVTKLALISSFISGCFSDDSQYLSLPVLTECKLFAEKLINDVKSRSDYKVELRTFTRKPVSHNELYGYINIYSNPEEVYKALSTEINTFEAYCYADSTLAPLDNYFADEVERLVSSFTSGSYRKDTIYVDVENGQFKIHFNKLDSANQR